MKSLFDKNNEHQLYDKRSVFSISTHTADFCEHLTYDRKLNRKMLNKANQLSHCFELQHTFKVTLLFNFKLCLKYHFLTKAHTNSGQLSQPRLSYTSPQSQQNFRLALLLLQVLLWPSLTRKRIGPPVAFKPR